VVCGLSVSAADAGLFDQATAKYKASDFKSAADLYQKQIQSGSPSAAAYYNLGNATLRSGQKGLALVYFERALEANPRDKDARWNIQILKESLVDRIEEAQTNIILEPLKNVLDRIKVDELAIAFSVFLALLTLSVVLRAMFSSAKVFIAAIRGLIVVCLLATGAFFAWKVWLTKDPRAVVLEKEITARYGPSDQESKAILLHEGALGKIIDESGDWIYLQLANKNTGWVRKSACEII
jgi:tetratricopeptide (TPR) repeat protein